MSKRNDVVSASEIAAWEWCAESWRLAALGAKPGNTRELNRGKAFHSHTAAIEVWSLRAVWAGVALIVTALLLGTLWYLLARGANG